MKTVIILYRNGDYTTIKSKVALAIADSYLRHYHDIDDFEIVRALDKYDREYYLMVETGIDVNWILKPSID